MGVRGLQGTKGFLAPEVGHIGIRKELSSYDHRADIFSFGMFLYQSITCKFPYHDMPINRINEAVESGERPLLNDDDTSFHYLSQIMKACWEDDPKNQT